MSISKFNSEGYHDPTAYDALSSIENETRALRAFRPIIYVYSPLAGDLEKNVVTARTYSRFAVEQRYIPIAPRLLFPQFLDDSNPKERELGLFFGNTVMSKRSEVWVLGSHISSDMEAEIKRAKWKNYRLRHFAENLGEVQHIYEIRENSRILKDGTETATYNRDVVSCNILEVEVGTTSYCGGDTGHGSHTYSRIQDAACTDMETHSYTTRCGNNGFEVCLGGDCELEIMIRVLKFITKVLEEESKEVYD